MMFLSTSGLNQSYILKGIVNATVKRTLKAEELDEVDQFDNLYAQVQKKNLKVFQMCNFWSLIWKVNQIRPKHQFYSCINGFGGYSNKYS